ncbi:hypothetical protein GW932_01135 [archaeon]|nr:hypothetical protein [archaeon]
MGLFEIVAIPDEGVFESHFVRRNFQKGDSVNVSFNESTWEGVVVERKILYGQPYALVKTNKKVDDGSDALLNGYGLFCPFDGKGFLYFKDEPLPDGDPMYKKLIRWPMTQEEIDEANEPLPF